MYWRLFFALSALCFILGNAEKYNKSEPISIGFGFDCFGGAYRIRTGDFHTASVAL